MKTILIFDQLDADIHFAVLDGDYRHLNDVYINTYTYTDGDKNKAKELSKLIFKDYDDPTNNSMEGYYKVVFTKEFPAEVMPCPVILAGIIP